MTQQHPPVPADDPDGLAQPPAGPGVPSADLADDVRADPTDDVPVGESGPVPADDAAAEGEGEGEGDVGADGSADAGEWGGAADAGEWGGEADADAAESGAFAGPPPDVDVIRTAERGREADAARADTSDSAPTPTETPLETPAKRRG